jgi:glyoxylase-like metal-dependent hydrolase (beta-lactamase superfamily II)
VLIDTGLGPKVHGALPESLARAGADAATITDVLITHSHGDHVGGLLTAGGGLAFPAATIRMSSVEWAWLKSQSGMSALSAAIAPKVSTFVAGAAVLPGIFSVSIPGHTPGHVGYEISSRGKRLLDMGDSAHSSIVSLARPEWVIGYDKDPELGRSERLATLKRLAASHEPVFAPHFPFPGVGTIGAKGDGFVWKPGLP